MATVYVAFAENDKALQRSHPEQFQKLYSTWLTHHPEQVAHVVVVEATLPQEARAAEGGGADGAMPRASPMATV